MVVQLSRFAEDGSRRVSRITEAYGLDGENRYQFQDLYVTRLHGKTPDGSLIANLEFTGHQPTFSSEVHEHGLDDTIQHTRELWKK